MRGGDERRIIFFSFHFLADSPLLLEVDEHLLESNLSVLVHETFGNTGH